MPSTLVTVAALQATHSCWEIVGKTIMIPLHRRCLACMHLQCSSTWFQLIKNSIAHLSKFHLFGQNNFGAFNFDDKNIYETATCNNAKFNRKLKIIFLK